MEHFFELPVTYKGNDLLLNGRLVTFGYVYKFYIIVDGEEFVFERDDERQYRMLSEGNITARPPDPALISAIVDTLRSLSDS